MKRGSFAGTVLLVASRFVFVFWLASAVVLSGAPAMAQEVEPVDIPILKKWAGDYPLSALLRLPEAQRSSAVGYIDDGDTFRAVWQAFEPGQNLPRVDFIRQLVVFCRNVEFYNRTSISKITLRDGLAEVLAVETMSAVPIEDKVGMALALISREGVRFIQTGGERIPVAMQESAVDPLNGTYTIEGSEVRMVNGRHEVQAAPGSTAKIGTWVFGEPVWGDLNGDGAEDAALILVHTPGGSGTFYYVAVALKTNGAYRGTNGVLLGDRIAPQNVSIRNGVVIAKYADRRFEESMTTSPSIVKSKALVVAEGKLEVLTPIGTIPAFYKLTTIRRIGT
jgi:hypothetical protein